MLTLKRDHQGHFKPRGGGGGGRGGGGGHSAPKPRQDVPRNAFTPMFEGFRDELDKHHDRKERIVKASRDITALSKKIIFSLQRGVRTIHNDLPKGVEAETKARLDEVSALLCGLAPEVQGSNRHRYGRQLMCVEELVEALTFAHYLRHQRLMTYDEAVAAVARLSAPGPAAGAGATTGAASSSAGAGAATSSCSSSSASSAPHALPPRLQKGSSVQPGEEGRDGAAGDDDTAMEDAEAVSPPSPVVGLTETDYLMGVFDLSGEMMRFATTSAALNGELATSSSSSSSTAKDQEDQARPRTILTDMQELGSMFEMLPQNRQKHYQIKLSTLRTSVLKVENIGYGLKVRGSERPKGWMPDGPAPDVAVGGDDD